jgi:hypothetical protein
MDALYAVAAPLRQARQVGGDTAFIKVSYLGPCRGRQARIRHETGDLDGLVEWLPTRFDCLPLDRAEGASEGRGASQEA